MGFIKYDKNIDYTILIYISILILIICLILIYKQVLLKKHNKTLKLKINEEVQKNRKKDLQLIHQSRLAQMGEMISIIAHQWRQPLNAIASTTINIQTHIELNKFNLSKPKGKEDLLKFFNREFSNINLYICNLSETLDDFRNFYKPKKKTEKLNINLPIKLALSIIRSTVINNNIKLIENYKSSSELFFHKNELVQVILNILNNSQDSFNEGNILNPTITIQTIDLENEVCIEIRDNGIGINDDIIDKIYNPYFSTKSEKIGTGLGLYISKIIIEEQHNGKFYTKNYDSGIGFIIKIPR